MPLSKKVETVGLFVGYAECWMFTPAAIMRGASNPTRSDTKPIRELLA